MAPCARRRNRLPPRLSRMVDGLHDRRAARPAPAELAGRRDRSLNPLMAPPDVLEFEARWRTREPSASSAAAVLVLAEASLVRRSSSPTTRLTSHLLFYDRHSWRSLLVTSSAGPRLECCMIAPVLYLFRATMPGARSFRTSP